MSFRTVVQVVIISTQLLCLNAYGAPAIKDLTSTKKTDSASAPTASVTQAPRIKSDLQRHSVGIGIGQTFVMGNFSDNGEDKISWDLLYSYSASHSFDLVAGFHSSKHEHKNLYSRMTGLTTSFKGKLYYFDSFSPYALAGLGFYSPKVRRNLDGKLVESDSKLVFGYNMGAGTDLKLNEHFTVGVLAHYHNPFDVKQDLGPEVEGSYFKLLITTLYTF